MFMMWPSSTFLSFIDWYASREHIHNARTFTCKTPSRQVKTKTDAASQSTYIYAYLLYTAAAHTKYILKYWYLGRRLGWPAINYLTLIHVQRIYCTHHILLWHECPHQSISKHIHVPVWSSYIQHVLPATGFATQQWLWMTQASIIDANIHAFVLCPDGSEHGQNLLLAAQVTFEGDQNATVAFTLTLSSQFLKWKEISDTYAY